MTVMQIKMIVFAKESILVVSSLYQFIQTLNNHIIYE